MARRPEGRWSDVPDMPDLDVRFVCEWCAELENWIGRIAETLDEHDRPEPLLLDYKGAADALRIAQRTLRRLVKEKKVTPVRVGRSVRFTRESLLDATRRGYKRQGTPRLFSVRKGRHDG